MRTYDKLKSKVSGHEIQVQSAIEDGSGKNIENTYAKQDSYYAGMGVGSADVAKAIESNRTIENAEIACPPIVFGPTGGDAEVADGFSKFEYLEGNSIAWNQLAGHNDGAIPGLTITNNNGTYVINGTASEAGHYLDFVFECVSGHKYLAVMTAKNYPEISEQFVAGMQVYAAGIINASVDANAIVRNGVTNFFATATGTGNAHFRFRSSSSVVYNNTEVTPQLFDLTVIYGAGFEVNNISDFRQLYPSYKYPFEKGTIISSKSASLISRQKNQCSGLNEFIRVLPNTEYELSGITTGGYIEEYDYDRNLLLTSSEITSTTNITLSPLTYYVKIKATTYDEVMFYITYETYNEPYVAPEKFIVNLPNIELRGIGDAKDRAYRAGGGYRKIKKVDLGTFDWSKDGQNWRSPNISDIKIPVSGAVANIRCVRYTAVNINKTFVERDFAVNINGALYIRDTEYSTPADFKAAVTGLYLYYELAEPTEISLDENPGWAENVKENNYGTLEFTTNPQQVPQIPQPYFIKYNISLVDFLDSTYVRADGSAENLALQEDVDRLDAQVEGLKDGTIPAGLANNLNSRMTLTDITPYLFRSTGGAAEVGDNCLEEEIVGGSLVLTQMIDGENFSSGSAGVWSFDSTTKIFTFNKSASQGATITFDAPLIQGHIYYAKFIKLSGDPVDYFYIVNSNQRDLIDFPIFTHTAASTTHTQFNVGGLTDQAASFTARLQLFDLSVSFGTTVAEYLQSAETSQSGSGVAWIKKFLPRDYYAPAVAPSFLNVKVSGKKSIGFNQLDLTHMTKLIPTGLAGTSGYISNLTDNTYIGHYAASNYWSNTDDLVSTTANSITTNSQNKWYSVGLVKKVLPSQTYYLNFPAYSNSSTGVRPLVASYDYDGFYIKSDPLYTNNSTPTFIHTYSTPSNCQFIIILFPQNIDSAGEYTVSDINLSLRWDGERDGDVEEYQERTYPIGDIDLRGLIKLDNSTGEPYYDGDIYSHVGKATRRYRLLDLGTINYYRYGNTGHTFRCAIPHHVTKQAITALCTQYVCMLPSGAPEVRLNIDKSFCALQGTGTAGVNVYFRDDSYTHETTDQSVETTFKNHMSGIYILYESNDTTEEDTMPFAERQFSNNWGIEEYLDNREVPMPVGHVTEYLLDLKAKLEAAPDSPEQDGLYAMLRNDGTNSYSPLSKSTLGLENVDNTSDANKPISTATQAALDGKVPTTRKVNNKALSSDISLGKSDVGLGNVVNTGDSATPVSGGTTKFTTGGAYTELNKKLDKKPDGVNDLIDSNNKVSPQYIPDSILGQLINGGVITALNDTTATATLTNAAKYKLGVSANTLTLTNNTAAQTGYLANEGIYYVNTEAGVKPGEIHRTDNLNLLRVSNGAYGTWHGVTFSKGAETGSIVYNGTGTQDASTHQIGTIDLEAGKVYTFAPYSDALPPSGSYFILEVYRPGVSQPVYLSSSKIASFIPDVSATYEVRIYSYLKTYDNFTIRPAIYEGVFYDYFDIHSASGSYRTWYYVVPEYTSNITYYSYNSTNSQFEESSPQPTSETFSNEGTLPDFQPYDSTFAGLHLEIGDWLVATSAGWTKIDNTDAVMAVNGKTGYVQLTINDIPGLRSELDATGGTVARAIQDAEKSLIVMDHAIGAYEGYITATLTEQATLSGVSFSVDDTKTISDITVKFEKNGGSGKTFVVYNINSNTQITMTKKSVDGDIYSKKFEMEATGVSTLGFGIQNATADEVIKIKYITVNYSNSTSETVTPDNMSGQNATTEVTDKYVYKNVGLHIPIIVYDATQGTELLVQKVVDSTYYKIISDLPFDAYVMCWNDKYGGEDRQPVRGFFGEGDDSTMYMSTGFKSAFRQSLDEKYWVGPC